MRQICVVVVLGMCALAWGDEVIFKNGDKLTGTVLSADGGKLKIKTAVAGDVTVNMSDVQTFSTDHELQIRMKDKTIVRAQPTTGEAGHVVADGKTIAIDDVKRINTSQSWTGAIVANGNITRGNTHSEDFGVSVDAALRRDDENHDDRFTLGGGYNFGKQRDQAGVSTTSADNWFALAKYDKFFTEKFYGYGLFRYDHDRIAFLNYRLSPGVGVGYQWIESADMNFSTEAGVSYVYEDYSNDGNNDRIALRLAYHFDKKLNDKVSFIHNLEYLPSFEDPGDYNLNTDAGIRATLTAKMFSEFKVQWQRDSTPAPDALKNDVKFLVGLGWTF